MKPIDEVERLTRELADARRDVAQRDRELERAYYTINWLTARSQELCDTLSRVCESKEYLRRAS